MSYPTNTKILKGFVFFQILFVSIAKTQLTKGFHGQTSGGFTLVQSIKFCFELGRKREFLYLISLPQPFWLPTMFDAFSASPPAFSSFPPCRLQFSKNRFFSCSQNSKYTVEYLQCQLGEVRKYCNSQEGRTISVQL